VISRHGELLNTQINGLRLIAVIAAKEMYKSI
jgi:hypothetical protein